MTILPLAEVRANLSKLVDEAERTHERVEVTKNGRRAAVLSGEFRVIYTIHEDRIAVRVISIRHRRDAHA